MKRRRVLAIAAATGKVGYAYFEDQALVDWELSQKASQSPHDASVFAERWINLLQPDTVVTEKITKASRKGPSTRSLINAINNEADGHDVGTTQVERVQNDANKYIEAAAIAERFPELRPKLPTKPDIWESEPRNMILFEAVALALPIIDGSTQRPHSPR